MKVLCDGVDEGVGVVLLCGGLTLLSKNENPRSVQLQNPKPLLSPFQPAVLFTLCVGTRCAKVLQGEELPQGQGGTKPQFQAYTTPESSESLGFLFLWPVLCLKALEIFPFLYQVDSCGFHGIIQKMQSWSCVNRDPTAFLKALFMRE